MVGILKSLVNLGKSDKGVIDAYKGNKKSVLVSKGGVDIAMKSKSGLVNVSTPVSLMKSKEKYHSHAFNHGHVPVFHTSLAVSPAGRSAPNSAHLTCWTLMEDGSVMERPPSKAVTGVSAVMGNVPAEMAPTTARGSYLDYLA